MNETIGDRIPLFREDYERLKSEHLWTREHVLFASNCSFIWRFGYIVITSERLIRVTFGVERGFFSSSREKVEVYPKSANPQLRIVETYPPPDSALTTSELKTRWVGETPLNTIIKVQREEREVSVRRERTKLTLVMEWILGEVIDAMALPEICFSLIRGTRKRHMICLGLLQLAVAFQ